MFVVDFNVEQTLPTKLFVEVSAVITLNPPQPPRPDLAAS